MPMYQVELEDYLCQVIYQQSLLLMVSWGCVCLVVACVFTCIVCGGICKASSVSLAIQLNFIVVDVLMCTKFVASVFGALIPKSV